MPQTECPKCHALQARRTKREGFVQSVILSKLGYFPWECRFCKATFVLKNRGHRKADERRERHGSAVVERGAHEIAGD